MTNWNDWRAGVRKAAFAGVLPLLALGGCDSFLDPKPDDVLTPGNFYQTEADAIAAVNGVYEQTRWAHFLSYWYMSDIATDDIGASPNFGADGHRMSEYIFDASEGTLSGVWGDNYRVINRANAVLDRVPAITMQEALKTRILGEAHFLRALAYFELVRFWGDVPISEHEVTSLEGLEWSRSPAAEVYALIESDLDAAIAGLPETYGATDDNSGRATAMAARALKAKVHLQQREWNEAAQLAGQVINSNRFTLLANWKDNFSIATEIRNSESIFELNYDGVTTVGQGSVHTLFSMPAGYPGGDSYGLMYVMPSLTARFAATDERGENGTYMHSPHYDTYRDSLITFTVPAQNAFNKYLDEGNTRNETTRSWQAQDNNWIVLRYADVLLTYAEAVSQGGGATAGTAESRLNQVRTRAGIAPVSGLAGAAFTDSLRLERRREFVFEGQRWFDLQRYNTLDAAMRAKQAELGKTPTGVPGPFFPIPQGEIDINPNLTQNPGY